MNMELVIMQCACLHPTFHLLNAVTPTHAGWPG